MKAIPEERCGPPLGRRGTVPPPGTDAPGVSGGLSHTEDGTGVAMGTVVARQAFEGGVIGAVQRDHRRVAEALTLVIGAVESGDTAVAVRAFSALSRQIRRHILVEDRHLIPIFEERTGMHDGPTLTLRREHREIERRLDVLAAALPRAAEAEANLGHVRALRALLEDHGQREETTLYPTCERLLDASERRRTLRALARKAR
jgi:hemerythrin-like domain-containing protein